jgi:hypothetical protein
MNAETVEELLGRLSPAETEQLRDLLRSAAERAERAWRSIAEPESAAAPVLQLVTEMWASKICTDAAMDAVQRLVTADQGTVGRPLDDDAVGLERAQALIRASLRARAQEREAPP